MKLCFRKVIAVLTAITLLLGVLPIAALAQTAESLVLSDTFIFGYVGERHTLGYTLEPQPSLQQNLSWSSDNEAVATVDSSGTITCISVGAAKITATAENGLTAFCNVQVKSASAISLNQEISLNTFEYRGIAMFAFTPQEDGVYAFISIGDNLDTRGYVYDSDMNPLESNDDYNQNQNFRVQCSMTSGQTYYLKSEPYNKESHGQYSVKVIKLIPATSMEIADGDSGTGYAGQGMSLSVNFNPENAIAERLIWTSSNEAVASVDSGGYVHFISVGTTTITVTSENGFTDTFFLTVMERPKATSVIISGNKVETACTGTSRTLWAYFLPENCDSEPVIWESNNPSVATVDSNGRVTFLSAGNAVITVSTQSGLRDSCTFTVSDCSTITTDSPADVSITDNTFTYVKFIPAESGNYRIYPTNISNLNVPHFTIFDSQMNLLAIGSYDNYSNSIDYSFTAGETYVIACNYGSYMYSGSGSYTVNAAKLSVAESIRIEPKALQGFEGTVVRLAVKYTPEFSTAEGLLWSSSDSSVAKVDNSGNLIMVSPGSAIITVATAGGLSDSIEVQVLATSEIVSNEKRTLTIDASPTGNTLKFTPNENGTYTFNIQSNNYVKINISTLDMSYNYGTDGYYLTFQIDAVAGKTYYINLSNPYGGQSFDCSIQINRAVPATSLEINYYGSNVFFVGTTTTLSVSFGPENAIRENVTWTSSDEAIATVNYGSINFISSGTVTLTATSESGLTDSITLKVRDILNFRLDKEEVITFTSKNDHARYTFTPTVSGAYNFRIAANLTSTTEYLSNYQIDIRLPNGESIALYDNKTISLTAGNTYYIDIYNYESVGTIALKASIGVDISNLEIAAYPKKMDYYTFENYPSCEDLAVKVTFSDGRTTIWYSNTGFDELLDSLGYNVSIMHHFTGNNYNGMAYYNSSTISCGNKSIELKFNVLETPVDRIEINNAPTKVYVYGDTTYGQIIDGDYLFSPEDLTGLKFTVYFKDGTSKTYTYEDIDKDLWQNIDGYNYDLSYNSKNPSIGDFPITFNYMGASATYNVKLEKSKVSSVAVTKAPNITSYINNRWYSADFIGAEITIGYSDGTHKTVTLSENNIEYYLPYGADLGFILRVNLDGYYINIEEYIDDYAIPYYVISYLGAECEYKGITFSDFKEIIKVEVIENTENSNGTVIKITYKDLTTETVTLNVLLSKNNYSDKYYSENTVIAKTQNGLTSYWHMLNYNDSGRLESYSYFIFGQDVKVPVKTYQKGDINGDGVINLSDLLRLKKIIAGTATDEYGTADLDGNGTVDASDLASLKKQLLAPAPVKGDINGDSIVDLLDLIKLKKIIAGTADDKNDAADLDGNGAVDAADLALLRKIILA